MRRRAAFGLLACLAVSGCGGKATASRTTTATVLTTPPAARTTTASAPKPNARPRPNPGSLPQTHRLPLADTDQFRAEMIALWRGVVEDSLRAGLPAFFPEGAYLQVKAIADARADYAARLLGDYRLDLGAAHALLGGHPRAARLVTVQVPRSFAHWVSPGACYNRVGYYEVPNARVVYREDGQVRSFGIASMISWRGLWYVVHLGAVVRSTARGVVDDPSSGSGKSAPSLTC